MNSNINSKIERLNSIQNSLSGLSKKIESINIKDYWLDQASEVFENNLKSVKSNFYSLDNKIDETIALLRNCRKNEEVNKNE